MSATLKLFRRLVVESGSQNLLDWGSIIDSMQDTACADKPIQRVEKVLAPGDTATLWEWASDADNFTLMLIECDGYAWIVQKGDAPTAADDNTPSGTKIVRPKEGISCFAPMLIQGMALPVLSDDNDYQDFNFDASITNGRRYGVYAKNQSDATADITIRAFIVP